MELKKFTVTDECISCMACVGLAEDIFQLGDNGKVFVIKQPQNKQEENLAQEAAEVCPVNAIIEIEQTSDKKPVLATDNVKKTLDKYPELKQVLIQLSPKFKRLQNPLMYNTLAKLVTFSEAAKITGVSLCELLHTINNFLGTGKQLYKMMPECIDFHKEKIDDGQEITWTETNERYIMNEANEDEIIMKIIDLQPQKNIVIISVNEPITAVKTAKSKNFKYKLEKGREWRLSIFNPQEKEENQPKTIENFEVLDVRGQNKDPFDIIIKKASNIEPGQGFVLIQSFEPIPIIKMLSQLGFESETKQISENEFHIYFYKKEQESTKKPFVRVKQKPEIVLQSATPVVYPIIMKLLQSSTFASEVKIKELKVWNETEKHLAWIVDKKADISFSALIVSNKLKDLDIKFKALVVWDNFVLLTKGYKAIDFSDIKGHEIYLPLFEEAPPAKITQYLMKSLGYDTNDFIFRYGKPFGRPEKILTDLILGKIDTAVLREPEASFAIGVLQDQGVDFSEIRYDDLWNKVNPGFGNFPNAGIVFKGDFVRRYPELTNLFLREVRDTIQWINDNKEEATDLSFEVMKQPRQRVLLFLNRVKFMYQDGEQMKNKVKQYFEVLRKHNIVQVDLHDKFLSLFS